MDRRLSETKEPVRFRIDATRCDGQGVCVLVAPELFELDRYGDAYVVPGAQARALDADVRARGIEADAMCPRNAILSSAAPLPREKAPVAEPHTSSAPGRLKLATGTEPVREWRGRGGWADLDGAQVLELVADAGIFGQGGASFLTAEKLRRVQGGENAVVIANGAEREPGTLKDRYLMRHRPGLVLDGLRHAMRAVGAREGVIAVDEESESEHDALTAALAESIELGLLDGLTIRLHRVPTRYVAGEETALINLIGGGPTLPRLRPPYPSDSGLDGRPTLVQNVETLAQIAVAAQLGAADYRSSGTPDAPGTGLFSVGRFGGPYEVVERPYGYSLRELLSERGLLEGAKAVLVGGYAGGILPSDGRDALDVALTPGALAEHHASLGTKAIQVIGPGQCPVGVVAEIVAYFADETAAQCPPCHRGLPDMAAMLRALESGTAGTATVKEIDTFMGTLFDRGVCRLPDGAARIAKSLLSAFAGEVTTHLESGCPNR